MKENSGNTDFSNKDDFQKTTKSKSKNQERHNYNYNYNYANPARGIIGRFFNFDSYITPSIIKFIYTLGVIILVFMSLFFVWEGIRYGSGGGVFMGMLLLIASPFIPRVMAEMLIIKFKTLEELQEINRKQ